MPAFNPLEHPIVFAEPARLSVAPYLPSTWIGHLPFGMALIDLLRPRLVVELGTYTGVSYCAFCQVVLELGVAAQCFAVDHWQGDAHTGVYGAEILDSLRAYHDPRYGIFSSLVQSSFDTPPGTASRTGRSISCT